MSKFLSSDNVVYLWSKIKALVGTKVDKVEGKGLSTNDYTDLEKTKLTGIAVNANNYSHPTYTARDNNLYKLTVDSTGHVSSATAATKADIAALGVNVDGQSYDPVTTTTDGLMSSADKTKLNGIDDGANNYVLPTASASVSGGIKVGTNLSINASGVLSATDTTYSPATSSANGLMSSGDKSKLDGFSAASNYALKSDITGLYHYVGSVDTEAGLPSGTPTTAQIGSVYNIVAASSYGAPGANVAWKEDGTWDSLGGIFEVEEMTNTDIDTICV